MRILNISKIICMSLVVVFSMLCAANAAVEVDLVSMDSINGGCSAMICKDKATCGGYDLSCFQTYSLINGEWVATGSRQYKQYIVDICGYASGSTCTQSMKKCLTELFFTGILDCSGKATSEYVWQWMAGCPA